MDTYNFPFTPISLSPEVFQSIVDDTTDGASIGDEFEELVTEAARDCIFYIERLLPSGVPAGEFLISRASIEASLASAQDDSGKTSFSLNLQEPPLTRSKNVSHIDGFAVEVPFPDSYAADRFFKGLEQIYGTAFVIVPGRIFGLLAQDYGRPRLD